MSWPTPDAYSVAVGAVPATAVPLAGSPTVCHGFLHLQADRQNVVGVFPDQETRSIWLHGLAGSLDGFEMEPGDTITLFHPAGIRLDLLALTGEVTGHKLWVLSGGSNAA